MVVLDVGERGLEVRFVVIIDQRDGACDVFIAEFLPVFDEAVANHVGNGQRTVVVAFLARHLIQLPQKRRRQGYAETADGFFFHGRTMAS